MAARVPQQAGQRTGEDAIPVRPGAAPAERRRNPWTRRGPLLPGLLFVILMTQIPFLLTVYYSFRSYNLYRPDLSGFAGWSNYAFVFQAATFRAAILNTIVLTAGAVLVALLAGLGIAVLLNRSFRGRALARTLAITPFLLMPVASALLWKFMMLDPSFGLVSFVLRPFFGTVDWLSQYPMASVIAAISWRWTPFMMLILLAGLQSQDHEPIEAAHVDGATTWQVFRYLTLPHLRSYMELSVLLATIFVLQTFDEVYMMTSGGPGDATTNLPYYIYLQAFRSLDIGQAAALGVVVLIGTLVVATVALRMVTRVFMEGIGR